VTLLQAALDYHTKGFSVIPVAEDKTPLIKWQPYQKTKATEDEIRTWWKKNPKANIGIVTGQISNLFVIDTDTSEATQKIQEAIPDNLSVPCQKTPKGGMHFIFAHTEGFSNRARVAEGIDLRTEGGYIVAAPSLNGTGKGWEWLVSPLEVDPPQLPRDVYNIINNAITSFNSFSLYREKIDLEKTDEEQYKSKEVNEVKRDQYLGDEGIRDEVLFSVSHGMTLGKFNPKIIEEVLERLILSWNENPNKNWIDAKIKSAMSRFGRKRKNLTQEFLDWISEVKSGQFKVKDWYMESNIINKEDKHTTIVVANNLCKGQKPLLERTHNRGEYRIIDREVEFTDFLNVSKEKAIDLTLPLEIHRKTVFFPRDIIVIAGVTGYGKTTFLLNVIKENMQKFEFKYFSSEMSALAINKKLGYFELPIEDWKMKVISDDKWDYSNIHDKIFPNDMNVIDYLEPEGEKTYNIHGVLTKISKRLEKGMALIATQKRPDLALSAGGVYSAKSTSLYLSLDWGTINIFKNRYREEDSHPQLTRRDFEIVYGLKFSSTSDWYDPCQKTTKKYPDSFLKDS